MQKILPIVHVLSKLGMLFSILLLVPTLVSYLYLDNALHAFTKTAVITIAGSAMVWLLTLRHHRELRTRDGFTLVFMLWVGFAAISAMPFYLYSPTMDYADSFFEAMSGLSTTGASVMSGLDTLAPSLNFWRHMLNWLGGMGIIVLAVAILPMLGVGGMQLFKAEIPGIDKDSKIEPRISQVAKKLWFLYFTFTTLVAIAYRIAGMSWFDAICHSMAALSLGGFSTHDNSIGYFNSVPIEVITMLAMFIAAVNFGTHFTALSGRSLKIYWRDEECKTMLITVLIGILIAAGYLWHVNYYSSFSESLRYVSFNFVSIALACGFTNTDFGLWPLIVPLVMLFLANLLTNSGSTGGGIKNVRTIVLFRFSLREMVMLLHPHAVRTVKVNGTTISERTALTVMAFIFTYFMTIVISTFIMMALGLDFLSSFTAMIACITSAGPGLGSVGPAHNYAGLNDAQKWVCSIVMLLGRLEIFTVFILFTPAYWKK